MPEAEPRSPMGRFASGVSSVIDGPITWFRGKNKRIPTHPHFTQISTLALQLKLAKMQIKTPHLLPPPQNIT